MFRTWAVNYNLLNELIKMGTPDCQRPKKIKPPLINHFLHHTAGVSKKSYMNNEILELYQSNPKSCNYKKRGPCRLTITDTSMSFRRH